MQYCNQFLKPKFKKQKKAKNNDTPTVDDICIECVAPYAHNHEIFFGKNRQLSIQYGLQVRLCTKHHEGDNGPHRNKEVDLKYKKKAQRIFVRQYGLEEFIKLFGRNYL